jgi:ATP-binding protein involved in chromosome partitioning
MKIILVASGKGGTGKTTTTAKIGRALARKYRVALLDLDVSGPNLAYAAGVDSEEVSVDENNFYPVRVGNLEVFSPSFLFPSEVACAWTGGQRMELIRELLEKVLWRDPDVMLLDAPPGTADELIAVLRYAPHIDGVIIVTTGKRESLDDARRLVSLLGTDKYRARILGIIINMSYMDVTSGLRVPLFDDMIDMGAELGIEVLEKIPFKVPLTILDYAPIADRIAAMVGLPQVGLPEEVQDGDH